MTWLIVVLLIGLTLLAAGGEILLRSALGAAGRLNISPALAGLVIVGFGTSMPEFAVSFDATLKAQPEIAIGNVVGSNIGNLLFILGLCALVHPLRVTGNDLKIDVGVMLFATLCLVAVTVDQLVSRTDGAVMLVFLLAYLGVSLFSDRRVQAAGTHQQEGAETQVLPRRGWVIVAGLILGLVLLVAGARLTLESSVSLAAQLGLPSVLVGLTVVALGTSLPEITLSLMATLRRHYDVAIANVIGSNIFNILGILGLCALVDDLPVSGRSMVISFSILLVATLLAAAMIAVRKSLGRFTGAAFLLAYAAYVGALYLAAEG